MTGPLISRQRRPVSRRAHIKKNICLSNTTQSPDRDGPHNGKWTQQGVQSSDLPQDIQYSRAFHRAQHSRQCGKRLPYHPCMLLTQKTRQLSPPPENSFRLRSRGYYLQNLQVRTNCNWERRNLVAADIVRLKDEQTHRNNWPLGWVLDRRKSPKGDCADLQG